MIDKPRPLSPNPGSIAAPEPAQPSPRTRMCLRCATKFPSDGPGERICPRCKSTKAWRDGAPLTAAKAVEAETARRRG